MDLSRSGAESAQNTGQKVLVYTCIIQEYQYLKHYQRYLLLSEPQMVASSHLYSQGHNTPLHVV